MTRTAAVRGGIAERSRETRGFIVMTAIAVGIGGVVLPFVGWLAGIIVMWLSPVWRGWEKLVATIAPAVLTGLSLWITIRVAPPGSGGGPFENGFGWPYVTLLLPVVVPVLVGAWLLALGFSRR